jgi:hypothetical protein
MKGFGNFVLIKENVVKSRFLFQKQAATKKSKINHKL